VSGVDGAVATQPDHAARTGAAGIVICDVHTGERFYQPAATPTGGSLTLLGPFGTSG
jgi:hypothetical protein